MIVKLAAAGPRPNDECHSVGRAGRQENVSLLTQFSRGSQTDQKKDRGLK